MDLRLSIEATGQNTAARKTIIEKIQNKMMRAEGATSFEEAFNSFIGRCAQGCKLVSVQVRDSAISFVVSTTKDIVGFAKTIETLIRSRFHQYIQVITLA